MEDVFIIHTRQHFKLTHHKLVSKRHPLIGPCLLHQDHRQQQERGTRDCRRILITSWPCRKMWKNVMVAATIFPKNFVSHQTTSWKRNDASLFKGNGVLVTNTLRSARFAYGVSCVSVIWFLSLAALRPGEGGSHIKMESSSYFLGFKIWKLIPFRVLNLKWPPLE